MISYTLSKMPSVGFLAVFSAALAVLSIASEISIIERQCMGSLLVSSIVSFTHDFTNCV